MYTLHTRGTLCRMYTCTRVYHTIHTCPHTVENNLLRLARCVLRANLDHRCAAAAAAAAVETVAVVGTISKASVAVAAGSLHHPPHRRLQEGSYLSQRLAAAAVHPLHHHQPLG
eukprot:Lankesteria_metandrocarpae@DN8298_c0_g1_i1.p1